MGKDNYNFQKLTPIKSVELKIYDDAFNFVFNNDDIRNVAISGAYSAGKSSVLETYKSKHSDMSFIHISLAHFKSTGMNNDSSGYDATLEGKILNQLIHQIDPEKIPQTNFKVKQKASTYKIAKKAVILTVFLILATYLGYFDSWSKFISTLSAEWLKDLLLWTTNSMWRIVSGLVCTAIFYLVVYHVIKYHVNKNILKKVNLQGTGIEIFEEKDDSYFDKYLNEVLYLFENSNANVIVFEDMDRYDENKIFEKLREVNTLINYKREKPIRFFYLLRDDIFVSKDRTKFFDFIIPIVPILDGSNSYDQFIEHFKQAGILEIFDEIFLQGLSLYIDDMRILKNIYNEFLVYHDRIQSIELNGNKLLAIIAYKNIFPKDFNDLQLGMGFVNTLFTSKMKFIEEIIRKIEENIKAIQKDINSTDKELLNSIEELDAAFLPSKYMITSVAGQSVSSYKTNAELVKAIKKNPNVNVYLFNQGVQTVNMTSEFNQLLQNNEYVERKEAIERKIRKRIQKLKMELDRLQNEKVKVSNKRLKELINKENIESIFGITYINEIGKENTFEKIKASPYFSLIKYLVRNGYIDETYSDYMTYFYENSLSRVDKIFLRSIADETPKGYSYSLINPQLVLSRLREVNFDHEEILNFDLLFYILRTKQSNKAYLARFLLQLETTKNFKFIGEFLETRRETDTFINSINHQWTNIAQCIITENDFSDEQKKQYVIDTLCYSSDQDIEALNANKCLTIFISENPDFLSFETLEINKIISGFNLLGVEFISLDYSIRNNELFNAVYQYNLYQLTFDHIRLMLKTYYNFTENDVIKHKNYTLISSKQDEPLAKYVYDNINHYIDLVIENCDSYIDDEESAVLAILNNTEIDLENKTEYISFLQTVIESIHDVIEKELWSLLLQRKIIKYSENNILDYFFQSEKGLDSLLVDFINTSNDNLSFDSNAIDAKFGENTASKFYSAIVTCNQLASNKYETILLSLNKSYKSFQHKKCRR